MTYAPSSLVELSRFLFGVDVVTLGIVGDARHTQGYHLGADRIYDGSGPGIGDADPSVKYARDRAGLTNAASAIDVGEVRGSLAGLQAFSRWLVARCQAGAPGSADVREVIYSPDGLAVQRWSGVDGLIHTGPGNGDSSHTRHSHVSYFRDSRELDKLALVAPYFPHASEAVMLAIETPFHRFSWAISSGTLNGYDPRQPGRVVKAISGPASGTASAAVAVSWPGTDPAPIPRGGPFLAVDSGPLAGLLIVAALVNVKPA